MFDLEADRAADVTTVQLIPCSNILGPHMTD
jgi:hypothetical protein